MNKKTRIISTTLSVAIICASTAFAQHDMSKMKGKEGMKGMEGSKHAAAHMEVSKAVADQLKIALKNYISIQDALTKDSVSGVGKAAAGIVKAADAAIALEKKEKAKDEELIMCLGTLSAAAKKLTGDKIALAAARKDFHALSDKIICVAEGHLSSSELSGINKFHCDMAKGSWLQKGAEPRNPYYGSSMLNCGESEKLGHHECKNCKKHAHGDAKGNEKNKLGGVSEPVKHEGCEDMDKHKD